MKQILDMTIVEFGTYTLKLHNVFSFAIFLCIVIFALYIFKRIIYRSKSLDAARKYSIYKLISYIAVVLAFIISLQLLGFDVSILLAGSAALLVGLGFGLQNLFSDFISGVILLLDRTLKVGDIVEVDTVIYKVLEINFRTTTVLGRNENYIILPNSKLTSNTVVNWTHSEIASRFKVDVGVDYSSNVPVLMKILKEAAQAHKEILTTPEPFVRFEDYADSALIFSVYFYTNEVFRVETIKSDLRIEIYKAFKGNNIEIPFPQRVVHLKGNRE